MSISEAACKPQERASKAKSLIGTKAHAVQQDSHTSTHTYNYTLTVMHTQSCTKTVIHIATQTLAGIATVTVPEDMHT